MRRFVSMVLVVMASVAYSAEPVVRGEYEVLRVKVHDVDTIRGDVALPFGVALLNQSIRAEGFDGWEVDRTRGGVEPFRSFTEAQWVEETAKGAVARDELRKLSDGGRWYVRPSADGKSAYGRLEGRLVVITKTGARVEVAEWALASGHVRGN